MKELNRRTWTDWKNLLKKFVPTLLIIQLKLVAVAEAWFRLAARDDYFWQHFKKIGVTESLKWVLCREMTADHIFTFLTSLIIEKNYMATIYRAVRNKIAEISTKV